MSRRADNETRDGCTPNERSDTARLCERSSAFVVVLLSRWCVVAEDFVGLCRRERSVGVRTVLSRTG